MLALWPAALYTRCVTRNSGPGALQEESSSRREKLPGVTKGRPAVGEAPGLFRGLALR